MATRQSTKKDPIFVEYARTAPRLDLQFFVAHCGVLPLAMLQRFQALHALMVKDEPKGKNQSAHKAAYRILTDAVGSRQQLLARAAGINLWAPMFTEAEYDAMRDERNGVTVDMSELVADEGEAA